MAVSSLPEFLFFFMASFCMSMYISVLLAIINGHLMVLYTSSFYVLLASFIFFLFYTFSCIISSLPYVTLHLKKHNGVSNVCSLVCTTYMKYKVPFCVSMCCILVLKFSQKAHMINHPVPCLSGGGTFRFEASWKKVRSLVADHKGATGPDLRSFQPFLLPPTSLPPFLPWFPPSFFPLSLSVFHSLSFSLLAFRLGWIMDILLYDPVMMLWLRRPKARESIKYVRNFWNHEPK